MPVATSDPCRSGCRGGGDDGDDRQQLWRDEAASSLRTPPPPLKSRRNRSPPPGFQGSLHGCYGPVLQGFEERFAGVHFEGFFQGLPGRVAGTTRPVPATPERIPRNALLKSVLFRTRGGLHFEGPSPGRDGGTGTVPGCRGGPAVLAARAIPASCCPADPVRDGPSGQNIPRSESSSLSRRSCP